MSFELRQPPTWVQLLAGFELCVVFAPLSLLGLFVIPLGYAEAFASVRRDGGLEAYGSVVASLCAVVGLVAAWRVLTRLAWYASGSLRLSGLELLGVLCGVGSAVPYLPRLGSPYLLYFDWIPVGAAALGVLHLFLHWREGRRSAE